MTRRHPATDDPLHPTWRDLRERPERCTCGAWVYQWPGQATQLDAQGWPHECVTAEERERWGPRREKVGN